MGSERVAQGTFSYEGICARVFTENEADIRWLEEFLAPWFDTSEQPADIEIRVSRDARLFEQLLGANCGPATARTFMMDASSIDFPAGNGPSGALALRDEKHALFFLVSDNCIELILRDRAASARMPVMRVLRELAMGVAQQTGGRFLHAAAFVVGGHAAIIMGPRRSGKTSLLSYVLANSSAGFLCNDRLLVRKPGPSVRVRGMPTIVSLREGTIELFPGMRQTIIDRGYTSGLTLRESRETGGLTTFPKRPGRHGLSARQYSSLLDCRPAGEAFGAVLLFPRQTGADGMLKVRRLTPGEARDRLQNCFFGCIGPDSLSDVFTVLPRGVNRQEAPNDAALCARLSESLAAYDCELGIRAYEGGSGARLLLDLVRDSQNRKMAGAAATSIQT